MTRERIDRWFVSTASSWLDPFWKRFNSSPVSVRLAKGVFWSLLGTVISRVFGVLSSIAVARLLGMTIFGEFTTVQSTLGLFGNFAGLGLGITATKYVAELRELNRSRCGKVISLVLAIALGGGLLSTGALLLFASWFATHALAAPHLASSLRWGSALVLFGTLQGVYSGALIGLEAFRAVARFNWTASLLGAPLMVAGAYLDGLEGAIIGTVMQGAISCGVGHVTLLGQASGNGIHLSCIPDFNEWRILWRFSLPAFLSSVLAGPASWACNTMLAHQPEGYQEIALLNAAGQWKNLLSFLPLTLISVLVPMFATLYHAGERAEFHQLLRRQLLLNVCLCLLLATPLALLSPLILDCYGPGFRRGILVFIITVSGTDPVAATNLMSRAMQACGRAWMDLALCSLWAAVILSACFFLVPAYKALGLAIAHVLGAAVLALCQGILMRNVTVEESVKSHSNSEVAASSLR